jgi:hypothetical protein
MFAQLDQMLVIKPLSAKQQDQVIVDRFLDDGKRLLVQIVEIDASNFGAACLSAWYDFRVTCLAGLRG